MIKRIHAKSKKSLAATRLVFNAKNASDNKSTPPKAINERLATELEDDSTKQDKGDMIVQDKTSKSNEYLQSRYMSEGLKNTRYKMRMYILT